MKLTVPRAKAPNPLYILRRAGYATFIDPVTKDESFVLRLGPAYYPRFHVYVTATPENITINLHLDQKQPSYGKGSAHNGEYSGPTVEREMQRITTWINAVEPKTPLEQGEQTDSPHIASTARKTKISWTDWLFG